MADPLTPAEAELWADMGRRTRVIAEELNAAGWDVTVRWDVPSRQAWITIRPGVTITPPPGMNAPPPGGE